jgi:hypothetical protein
MYEQSWESAHACVVKYIRARLPSQSRRARLVRAPLVEIMSVAAVHTELHAAHHTGSVVTVTVIANNKLATSFAQESYIIVI